MGSTSGKADMDRFRERHPGGALPQNAFSGDIPLVAVERGNYTGSLHRGALSVLDDMGTPVVSLGDPDQPAFLRSSAKPFQAIPAIISGGVDRFGITPMELAVLCASHGAEPRHLDAVFSVLEKIGAQEFALHCGVHAPLHEETARQRWRSGLEPTPVCNNCSGSHAGMLVACRAMGWPLDTYEDPDHPLQVMTRGILASFAGVSVPEVGFAVDNCAVPTFLLPLNRAAVAFARLGSGRGVGPDLQQAAGRIVEAMTQHPEMVGGENRFDTDLMRAAAGTIVAKGGAEGFQGIAIPPRKLGIALKVSDGNSRAIPPTIMPVLHYLQALTPEQERDLASYAGAPIKNHQGKQVGRLSPLFSLGSPS